MPDTSCIESIKKSFGDLNVDSLSSLLGNVEKLKEKARKEALQFLSQSIRRPDQLDRIEEFKVTACRKRATLQAVLKASLQAHFEEKITGLKKIQDCEIDSTKIMAEVEETKEAYSTIKHLSQDLKQVKEENKKYRQYATAVENLKSIFNTPEIISETRDLISNGNLLLAHKNLHSLENSRDELLSDIYKESNYSVTNVSLINRYFQEVLPLSDGLAKQLWLIVSRMLTTVRKDPKQLVTVVRIIEREERNDFYYNQRKRITKFLPPGRPKMWKQKMFEIVSKSIDDLLEGSQNEDRSISDVWLVKHLELIRLNYEDNFKVIKTGLVHCFPQSYDIVELMTGIYHDALTKRLMELIENGLKGNEIITLLQWTKEYDETNSKKRQSYSPLLKESVVEGLMRQYLLLIEANIKKWIENAIQSDYQDWLKADEMPDSDEKGLYYTSLPFIIGRLLEEHLDIANHASPVLLKRMAFLLISELVEFVELYSKLLIDYKILHAQDRSEPAYYVQYLIAAVNNLIAITEHSIKVIDDTLDCHEVDEIERSVLLTKKKSLVSHSDDFMDKVVGLLLNEVLADLQKYFSELFTPLWISSTSIIDTIKVTIEDYCQDFSHLNAKSLQFMMGEMKVMLCLQYLTAILSKRITFKSFEEQKEGAERLLNDASILSKLFYELENRLFPPENQSEKDGESNSGKLAAPFSILQDISEIFKLKDASMLSLDLMSLIRKYPEAKKEHLQSFLSVRGDLGRFEIRKIVADAFNDCSENSVKNPFFTTETSEVDINPIKINDNSNDKTVFSRLT